MRTLSKRKKKLEILRKMLELISSPYWDLRNGLCLAQQKADYPYYLEFELEDLGIKRTKRGDKQAYWWPLTERGLASRKRAVRSAIKRLTAKKK